VSTRLETLHEVRREGIRSAAACLARAFERDPVWTKVFEGVPGDKVALWYESAVRYCLVYGRVYASSDRFEGVVALLPGQYADMTMWRMLRAGSMKSGMRMGLRMTMRATQLLRIFRPLEVDRREHMRDREYTYVLIVGVTPELQGQGFGGTLLRALNEESDLTGVPIYLETETVGNRDMYEHLGFESLREIALPVVNLPMWEMLREPAS